MVVSLKRADVFVPDWRGNLDQPEDRQVKFHFRFIGSADRKSYVYAKPMEFTQEIGKTEGQLGKMEMIQDGKGLALRMVTRIENLELEYDDGKKVVIDDIREFYKYPLSDLAAMVESHMLEATAVVDSKNSE